MEVAQVQENDTAKKTENSILPDPPLKHPLEHRWTLWFYENDPNKGWLDNVHDVYTFDTVEDFWCLFNNITAVGDLTHGNDYSIFKHGIQPKWEDPRNKNGGRWVVNVDGKYKHDINDWWLNVVLYMIGESFDEYSAEICGAYINIRAKCRISLWTTDSSKIDSNTAIGKKLKYECLHLKDDYPIFYETHKESQNKTRSRSSTYSISC